MPPVLVGSERELKRLAARRTSAALFFGRLGRPGMRSLVRPLFRTLVVQEPPNGVMHILVVSADGASASGGPTQCFVPPLPPPATLAPFPALAPRSRRLPPLADPPIMRAVLLLLAALAVGAQGCGWVEWRPSCRTP